MKHWNRWTRAGLRRTSRGAARRLASLATVLLLIGGTAACGEDDPTDVEVIDLELVEGLYEILTITFDPQGSAPAADVLDELVETGVEPTLNIGLTGNFQLFFRDPVSGDIQTINGDVEPTENGIELVFGSQSSADWFLYPLRVPLEYDEASETLSFSGTADVNRVRLQELFPELYGEEPWTSETIPGFLTTAFQKTED